MYAIRIPAPRGGVLYLSQVFPPKGPVCWTDALGNALAFGSSGCAAYWLERITAMGADTAGALVVPCFAPEEACHAHP